MTETRTEPRALSATEKLHRQAVLYAEERFRDHVVTKEGEGRFYCGKPGTSNCHFRVVISPGAIFMHGDIYELILLPSDRDSLTWLRSALRDGREVGYPLSKIPHSMDASTTAFSEEWALEILAQYDIDDPDRKETWAGIRETIRSAGHDAREAGRLWAEAWYEALHDGEIPNATTWTPMVLWQLEALRWFVRHLPEEKP